MSSKNYEKGGDGIDLALLTSCNNRMFHIVENLQEEGRSEKVTV